ncbi:MAG TPA: sigma-70 family RNA polymerase sigma factor [Vicinamibacterales bacterium]|nr:sigma-70 family RNA polymerase sigma factor [Vicinamibacterales bacterium]
MAEHEHSAPGGVWSAFETEAMPHVDRLFRLAMWWERDRGAAEDLVQDTLVQALKSFHRFTPGTNCRAWLATILRHVRSNKRRAQFREPLVDDPDDRIAETVPFVPAVPERITDEDMLMALRGIPELYQDIILLCDVEEFSYKDIAQALGIPMGTVMSRLHRGRGLLRQALAAQHSASSDHGRSRDVSSEGVG